MLASRKLQLQRQAVSASTFAASRRCMLRQAPLPADHTAAGPRTSNLQQKPSIILRFTCTRSIVIARATSSSGGSSSSSSNSTSGSGSASGGRESSSKTDFDDEAGGGAFGDKWENTLAVHHTLSSLYTPKASAFGVWFLAVRASGVQPLVTLLVLLGRFGWCCVPTIPCHISACHT